ncbi:chemotaxis protein CheW [Desulfococcaceae bacterium HSG7]|nr:chemotaxis protein CheW [Desulfococcaceae bacterium HSG7]
MVLTDNSATGRPPEQSDSYRQVSDEKLNAPVEATPYLIFQLHETSYGVDALAVREIFRLPELTAMEEAPDFIAGVFNLRGRIVPVVDLDMRMGGASGNLHLSDSVIVVEIGDNDNLNVGMIVNEVRDVNAITVDVIEQASLFSAGNTKRTRLISHNAKMDEEIIMLLNHKKLLTPDRFYESLMAETSDHQSADDKTCRPNRDAPPHRRFFPDATPEERQILHERARNLMMSVEDQDFTGLVPIAVVGLNGEYFGVNLELVREFATVGHVTPIPCCPEHIIGNINLRGDILTLTDIRGILNMPMNRVFENGKIIVVNNGELQAGVWVDDVFDVIYLQQDDMTRVPAAVKTVNEDYLKGMAPYRDKMLTAIDLNSILTQGDLIVDEAV